jgi:hypothetical protein
MEPVIAPTYTPIPLATPPAEISEKALKGQAISHGVRYVEYPQYVESLLTPCSALETKFVSMSRLRLQNLCIQTATITPLPSSASAIDLEVCDHPLDS